MIGIFKSNEIETLGGTTPQGSGIKQVGLVKDWNVVEVPDDKISSVQEFNITYVDDSISTDIHGPQHEGAYNAPAYELEGIGDKLTFEMNPNQVVYGVEGVEDGTKLTSPDEMDDKSQKNFTSEDVKPYKNAYAMIKKITEKTNLRSKIRGDVADFEDDLSDSKSLTQIMLKYFAVEINNQTNPTEKNKQFADKILSDDTILSVDLQDSMLEKIKSIISKEDSIQKIVKKDYKYDVSRGV